MVNPVNRVSSRRGIRIATRASINYISKFLAGRNDVNAAVAVAVQTQWFPGQNGLHGELTPCEIQSENRRDSANDAKLSTCVWGTSGKQGGWRKGGSSLFPRVPTWWMSSGSLSVGGKLFRIIASSVVAPSLEKSGRKKPGIVRMFPWRKGNSPTREGFCEERKEREGSFLIIKNIIGIIKYTIGCHYFSNFLYRRWSFRNFANLFESSLHLWTIFPINYNLIFPGVGNGPY